jgi:tetratricopeptide (TPR) repeat protein
LRAALGKADALNLCSEPAKAREISEKALPLAQEIGDGDVLLRLLLAHLRSMMRTDDLTSVRSDAIRVLAIAEERKDVMAEATACSALHFYYRMQLNAQAARDWGARSAECALQAGDVDFACLVLLQMATAEGLFWRFDAAWHLWRRIDGLIEQGSQLAQAHYFLEKTRIHVQLERYDEAAVFVGRAIELFDSAPVGRCDLLSDRQRSRVIAQIAVASIALARRNCDEGVAIIDQLLSSAPVRQSETVRANVVELAARLLAGRRGDGDLDRAWYLVCGIDETAIAPEEAQYLMAARALVAAAMGRPDARTHIRAALDESIRIAKGNPIEADACFETLANAAREAGDAELEAEASDLFEHFNAMRRQAAGAAWNGAGPVESTDGSIRDAQAM